MSRARWIGLFLSVFALICTAGVSAQTSPLNPAASPGAERPGTELAAPAQEADAAAQPLEQLFSPVWLAEEPACFNESGPCLRFLCRCYNSCPCGIGEGTSCFTGTCVCASC